jgi:hypothetical protein
MELTDLVAVGLAVLALMLILVWYYGHALRVASDLDMAVKTEMLAVFAEVRDAMALVAKSIGNLDQNIDDLKRHVTDIDSYAHTADVEWKVFNEQKIAPMLHKLDEISGLSVDLGRIEDRLGEIESAVDAIAAHPAFKWPRSKQQD